MTSCEGPRSLRKGEGLETRARRETSLHGRNLHPLGQGDGEEGCLDLGVTALRAPRAFLLSREVQTSAEGGEGAGAAEEAGTFSVDIAGRTTAVPAPKSFLDPSAGVILETPTCVLTEGN